MDTDFKNAQWRSRCSAAGNEAKYSSGIAGSIASLIGKHKLGKCRFVEEGQSENNFTWFITFSLKNLNNL